MLIQVEEQANSYLVRFRYDPQAVTRIKTIPGRRFLKEKGNAWEVPKTSERALMRFLTDFGDADVSCSGLTLRTHAGAREQRPGADQREVVQPAYQDTATIVPTCGKGPARWQHQLDAFRYVWNREAALIDLQMGVGGKSRIIVDYVCNKPEIFRVLIVCPHAVIAAWEKQFALYGGKSVRVVQLGKGSVADKQQRAAVALTRQREEHRTTPLVLIVNYDSVWRPPLGDWLLGQPLDLLVLDEVQRAKGTGSSCATYCYALGAATPVRVGLSGTPFPHEIVRDAYGVYRALDPTIFGTSFARHQQHYCLMGGYNNHEIKEYVNTAELRAKVDSIRFHVAIDESALPEEMHTTLEVDMPERVWKLYRELARHYYAKVESGEVTAANAAVASMRLRQLVSGYLPVEESPEPGTPLTPTAVHTAKQEALRDFLADLPDDEPVVVFAYFTSDLARVHEVAARLHRTSSELSGRRHELEAWQAGKSAILAVQYRAGAVGVDMTRASIAVYYSYTYRLEEYEQSLRRLRRPGQTRTCRFYHLVVADSIDEVMRAALAERRHVLDAILARPAVTA